MSAIFFILCLVEDGGAFVGADETVDVAVAPGHVGVALELSRRRLIYNAAKPPPSRGVAEAERPAPP